MDTHIITKNIGDLRGISTDSIFIRPPNVAETATNVIRYPDGTLAARRGYQCEISDIGGLGNGTYHSTATDSVDVVTVNDNGNLYKRLNRQIFFYYDGRVTGAISGASKANPCGITSINHGLQTGTQVIIRSVSGMYQLNNHTYTITVTGPNAFTLDGVDSSSYSTYTSGGEWSIAFADGRYLEFRIFTDTRYLSARLGWSVSPWSISPWGAPQGESISCQIRVRRAGSVDGSQTNVNTIQLDFGHEFSSGDFVKFTDTSNVEQTRSVTGTTSTSITIDGFPTSVLDGIYVDQFFDIPFYRGFDLITVYKISDFLSQIGSSLTGIYGLNIDYNGDINYAAAFLPITELTIINSGSLYTIEYYYWNEVNKTIPTLLPGIALQSYQNSDDFENASFATYDDVVYIADGIDYPVKYDDQTAYLVGMPKGIRPSVVKGTSGKLSDGSYLYGITYAQVDNIGHYVEGVISDTYEINLQSGPSNAIVSVNNILSNSGYNTDCALAVAGIATSYGPDENGFYYDLISVASGHTMNFGDTAFYTDNAAATKDTTSGSAETTFQIDAGHAVVVGDIVVFTDSTTNVNSRSVSRVSTNSITVDGAAVIVSDNTTFSTTKEGLVYGDLAIVDGTQNDVTTIQVLSGHSIKNSDYVVIIDTQGIVHRRTVSGISSSSITINGYKLSISDGSLIYCESLQPDSITVRRSAATPPTLSSNSPISNNLRINIWRTAQDGTLLQLLTTLPNNSFTNSQTYTDNIQAGRKSGSITGATQANPCQITSPAHGLSSGNLISIQNVLGMVQLNDRTYTVATIVDKDNFTLDGINSTSYTAYTAGGTWSVVYSENSQLGINFPDPIRLPNPPPISKYVLSFNNQLLYAGGKRGDPENDDNVFFSEGDLPESVPAATNFFTVPSTDDQITGLGKAGTTLIITKEKSVYGLTGDLLTSQFQLESISPDSNIGCIANATIKSVGSLLYFLSRNGVYAISENQFYPIDALGNPVPLSRPIDLYFRQTNYLPPTRYVLRRAVAINYAIDHQYLLFLPCEDSQTTQRVANSNSIILCYDYQDKNWFKWNNMNCAGGMFIVDNNLYFQERRFSGIVGNTANLYRQHRHYRLIDHADHTMAQDIQWASSWEDLGLPMVRKKFSKCIFLIDTISDLYQFNDLIMNFYTCIDRIQNNKSTIAGISTVNNNNNAGWSSSPWGTNRWAGYQDSFAVVNLKGGTVAKAMQVGFSLYGMNTDFRLSGFQLEVIPENRRTVVR